MRITLASGTEAILAHPDGPPVAGLVLLPDVFGLRPLFDNLCDRLARDWRMAVCAPEPFPTMEAGADLDNRLAANSRFADADRLRDVDLAADATGCDRVGLVGFCQGGFYAYKATTMDRFARLVAFYGPTRTPPERLGPGQRQPLDALAAGHAERLLALVGGQDPLTPADDLDEIEKTGATVVRYPDAGHAFAHDPGRPAHRPDDAADAWLRCREWLTDGVSGT